MPEAQVSPCRAQVPGVRARRAGWEVWSPSSADGITVNFSPFSFNPGVIYSFPVVGRNGFSKALLGLPEKRRQEMLASGGGGSPGTLEEGCSAAPPPPGSL